MTCRAQRRLARPVRRPDLACGRRNLAALRPPSRSRAAKPAGADCRDRGATRPRRPMGQTRPDESQGGRRRDIATPAPNWTPSPASRPLLCDAGPDGARPPQQAAQRRGGKAPALEMRSGAAAPIKRTNRQPLSLAASESAGPRCRGSFWVHSASDRPPSRDWRDVEAVSPARRPGPAPIREPVAEAGPGRYRGRTGPVPGPRRC